MTLTEALASIHGTLRKSNAITALVVRDLFIDGKFVGTFTRDGLRRWCLARGVVVDEEAT